MTITSATTDQPEAGPLVLDLFDPRVVAAATTVVDLADLADQGPDLDPELDWWGL